MTVLIPIIRSASTLLTIAVLVDIVLSYFMDPFHPVRRFFDSLVEPMLNPIRRLLPTMGGLDFSPLVLIILIEIIESVLISLVRGLG